MTLLRKLLKKVFSNFGGLLRIYELYTLPQIKLKIWMYGFYNNNRILNIALTQKIPLFHLSYIGRFYSSFILKSPKMVKTLKCCCYQSLHTFYWRKSLNFKFLEIDIFPIFRSCFPIFKVNIRLSNFARKTTYATGMFVAHQLSRACTQ